AWRGGGVALDVTVPHVLTKRTPSSATGLHAMEAARARKLTKYQESCRSAGFAYTVLAFDTLGAAHPDTEAFLSEVFKEAGRRELSSDPRYAPHAWDRPLQVDVARQVLARVVDP